MPEDSWNITKRENLSKQVSKSLLLLIKCKQYIKNGTRETRHETQKQLYQLKKTTGKRRLFMQNYRYSVER